MISPPYFKIGCIYVLYVVFGVAVLLPHLDPANRFNIFALLFALAVCFSVCCLSDNLLSRIIPK
jgi:hypothetical protein